MISCFSNFNCFTAKMYIVFGECRFGLLVCVNKRVDNFLLIILGGCIKTTNFYFWIWQLKFKLHIANIGNPYCFRVIFIQCNSNCTINIYFDIFSGKPGIDTY